MRDSFKFPLFYADLGETGSRVSSRRKWRHVIHDIWRPGCEKSSCKFSLKYDRLSPRLPFISLDIYTRFSHINGFSLHLSSCTNTNGGEIGSWKALCRKLENKSLGSSLEERYYWEIILIEMNFMKYTDVEMCDFEIDEI